MFGSFTVSGYDKLNHATHHDGETREASATPQSLSDLTES